MSPDNLHIVSLGGFVDYTSDQGKRIKTVFAVGEGDRSAGRKGTFLDADNAWEVGGYGSDFFDEEPGCDRGDDPIDDFSVEHEDPFIPTLAYPESPPDVPTFGPVPMVRLVMKIPLSFFLASGERNDRILIRSEFDEAEAGALSAARGSGPWVFLVTGQPGIGLPPSLHHWRILMRFPRRTVFPNSASDQKALPQAPDGSAAFCRVGS